MIENRTLFTTDIKPWVLPLSKEAIEAKGRILKEYGFLVTMAEMPLSNLN